MKNIKTNISLIAITFALTVYGITHVHAQQMLLEIIGGGYRFEGPSTIIFDPVPSSISEEMTSIRSVTQTTPNYIQIEDQNAGAPFDVRINASGPFMYQDPNPFDEDTYPYTIPLSKFYVKNTAAHTTINGRHDGFSINNIDFTNLNNERTLGTGTGEEPGTWRIYPDFKIEVPPSTPPGVYSTTIVFTII
jgi:hypothetical protein